MTEKKTTSRPVHRSVSACSLPSDLPAFHEEQKKRAPHGVFIKLIEKFLPDARGHLPADVRKIWEKLKTKDFWGEEPCGERTIRLFGSAFSEAKRIADHGMSESVLRKRYRRIATTARTLRKLIAIESEDASGYATIHFYSEIDDFLVYRERHNDDVVSISAILDHLAHLADDWAGTEDPEGKLLNERFLLARNSDRKRALRIQFIRALYVEISRTFPNAVCAKRKPISLMAQIATVVLEDPTGTDDVKNALRQG